MTPNAAHAKGITVGPVVTIQDLTGWFYGPWFDPFFEADVVVPGPSIAKARTLGPTIVQATGNTHVIPQPSRARGLTPVPLVLLKSLKLAPQPAAGHGVARGPRVIQSSLSIRPAKSTVRCKTTGPIVVLRQGPIIANAHDTRFLGNVAGSADLYLGADSSGSHKLTGALDYVRILKGRAISTDEAKGHRDIILGLENGSAYPEVGHALGQYWSFYRLAQFYFISNDPGARDLLENWLTWLDAFGAPDGSG
jgi:hypothetical protein